MRVVAVSIVILLLASCAWAAEAGKITYAEGRVDILTAGADKGVPAVDGTAVNVGDAIRTKSNSRAEVRFYDKTVMRIAANSRVDIIEYRLDADNNRVSAEIKLERGKARTIIAKMRDAAEFRINTPNAHGSVKGSDIVTFFQAGNSGMMVTEGTLSVFSTAHPKDVISVPAGSAVLVPLEELPKGPRRVLEVEQKLHEQDTAIPETIGTRKGAAVIRGTIAKFTGDVRVTPKGSGDAHPAKQGEVVGEGDKVTTGAGGIVEIAFDNGNALYLKGNTHITILKLIVDSKTGEFENLFEADKGDVKARVEGLKGKSKFEIKTPTAVCGARGTIILVHIEPDGSTQSFFEGGNGYTTNLQSGQTLESNAGSGAMTGAGGGVTGTDAPGGDDRSGMDNGFDPDGGTGDSSGGTGGGEGLGDTGGGSNGGVGQFSDTVDNANNDTVDTDVVDVPITEADSSILEEEEVEHITQVGDFFYTALDANSKPYLVNDVGGMYDFVAAGPNTGDPDDFALVWAATSSGLGVAVTLSGNYDIAGVAKSRFIWTTDELYASRLDGETVTYTTSDLGSYYCVIGGTMDTASGGVIRALLFGLYIDKFRNAGVLFGEADGDNTESFTLGDTSQEHYSNFWVDRIWDIDIEKKQFAIEPANLHTSIEDNVSLAGNGEADFGSGKAAKLVLTDGIGRGFNTPTELAKDFGIWAARFAGSFSGDLSGGFTMTLAGTGENAGTIDSAWVQNLQIGTWSSADIRGTLEGAYLSLHEDGHVRVGALNNGSLIGNCDDVDTSWQAVGGGEWIEVCEVTFIDDPDTPLPLDESKIDIVTTRLQELTANGYLNTVSITETVGGGVTLTGGVGNFNAGGTISGVIMDTRFYETIADANMGIWAATISGAFSGQTGPTWSATVGNVTLEGTDWTSNGTNGTWRAKVSGTITDAASPTPVTRTIVDGIAAGTSDSTTFKGSGIGTWTREGGTGGAIVPK